MNQTLPVGWIQSIGVALKPTPGTGRFRGRSALMSLSWILGSVLVASFEVAIDPLMAWEQLLGVLFALLIPVLALASTLALFAQLASPHSQIALAARHGVNRQRKIIPALVWSLLRAGVLTNIALVAGRYFCRPATEPLFQRDLLLCCGIGYLATTAYIAYFFAATRLGLGRVGAWFAFGLDLTLGHVSGGPSLVAPHRFVQNLIGHPDMLSLSAKASSWILLGLTVAGLTFAVTKTPR